MTNHQIDFTVDKNNLYREENIIDMRSATIRILTPVTPDGSMDENRKKIFVGHTELMSHQGPVPLHAHLKASTMEEAIENYPEAMQQALAEMIENVRRMQQEEESNQKEASRIIVPGR